MADLLIEEPKVESKPLENAQIKENAPKEKSFVAHLMSTTTAKNGDEVLTLCQPDGEIVEIWAAENFWKLLSKRITEDSYVQVKVEQRIAGKTTYKDQNDELQYHEKDGSNLRGLAKVSKALFDREVPVNTNDLDIITSAPEHAAGAVANYLASVRTAMMKG